eukprot:3329105-Amphidinium_carterae.1
MGWSVEMPGRNRRSCSGSLSQGCRVLYSIALAANQRGRAFSPKSLTLIVLHKLGIFKDTQTQH